MKRLSLFVFIASLLLVNQSVSGQSAQKAKPFDSWGRINAEDASARLDNFAIALQDRIDFKAYIVGYGPEGEGSGTGRSLLLQLNDYLVNMRGVDPDRIQTTYGGRYQNPSSVRLDLWLVPAGAEPPPLTRFDTKPDLRKGKIEEYLSNDEPDVDECGCGPAQGNITFAAIADSLQQQSGDVIYIVAFNLNGAAPGSWRRAAKNEQSQLLAYGIKPDRIKIIYGGKARRESDEQDEASETAKIQLWVLPREEPPPVKPASAEETPKEAMKIGSYNRYLLKYEKEERRVFAGFADVLRADEALSVCIIVRPAAASDSETPVLPDERPDIDPLKLVEKWKTELMEKIGLRPGRVTVIPATADETNEGTVEVWVVPPGAALPNPYVNDEVKPPDP